jgi:rubrerythrin
MEYIDHDLWHSMSEEHLAASSYRQRAKYARAMGDIETADLYEHIAQEEDTHEKEFGVRYHALRQAAREISRKIAEGIGK